MPLAGPAKGGALRLAVMLAVMVLFLTSAGLARANPVPKPDASTGALPAGGTALAVDVSLRPKMRRALIIPDARWSNEGRSRSWTLAILSALRSHARNLPDQVPRDIDAWCPAYKTAPREGREAFWVGLVSALAWHESTHRPTAVGGGGRWFGLTQIWPPTAKHFKCKVQSGAALKDPEDNLSCAMRIMAYTVPRDGVISAGMRGVAADWGPFHSRRKREDMRSWVSSQSYCAGLSRSLRPVQRPEALGAMPPAVAAFDTSASPEALIGGPISMTIDGPPNGPKTASE